MGWNSPNLDTICASQLREKASSIIRNSTHPGHSLFELLPSSKWFRTIRSCTNRQRNSFFPRAVLPLPAQSQNKLQELWVHTHTLRTETHTCTSSDTATTDLNLYLHRHNILLLSQLFSGTAFICFILTTLREAINSLYHDNKLILILINPNLIKYVIGKWVIVTIPTPLWKVQRFSNRSTRNGHTKNVGAQWRTVLFFLGGCMPHMLSPHWEHFFLNAGTQK